MEYVPKLDVVEAIDGFDKTKTRQSESVNDQIDALLMQAVEVTNGSNYPDRYLRKEIGLECIEVWMRLHTLVADEQLVLTSDDKLVVNI